MQEVYKQIGRLAPQDVTVLVLGESGTGKELVARALYQHSRRARGPFVAINCAAIPETLLESELFGYERGAFTGAHKQTIGKIESADRGTLFLDEIGDLPHPLQVKLLRFLQDQRIERLGGRQPIQVNVRVVSATNAALEDRVREGRFREDLFYRLNPVAVRIPPLRARGSDPLLLARYFLGRFSRELGRSFRGFSDDASDAISAHSWPGNVRELENRVQRAAIMADGKLVTAADLELDTLAEQQDLDIRSARMRAEREVIQAAMARSQGRLAGAAKLLGISRPTLYTLLQSHGLEAGPKGGDDGASETS
ncbi:MAG: sigma 54-interacting transcriptional regulator [Acetobacteraceae bacterium]|nr:sigma 54-interacting transcriptional regulator [Acetobacteraceae bacterium]